MIRPVIPAAKHFKASCYWQGDPSNSASTIYNLHEDTVPDGDAILDELQSLITSNLLE